MSNGQSPRILKQVSGLGDVLCELSALMEGSRYQCSSSTISTRARCSQYTFSHPFLRRRPTTAYLVRLYLAADLMSAIDDPFPNPLIGERLGDFVLTIFSLYA